MKMQPIAIFLLLITFFASSAIAGNVKYDRYLNARFAYGISYPGAILVPQGEADNGDGQKFISKDGRAIMVAYGCYNVLDDTLKGLFQDEISSNPANPGKRITYKKLKKDWFVVSGANDGKIFYKKVFYDEEENKFITFEITYPKRQRELYDPIVSEISKSIRVLKDQTGEE